MYNDDEHISISRNIVPGKFEVLTDECAIIVHYQILVDVFDHNYTTIAKRSRDKQIKITFTGMEPNSDIEEVVDSLIGQTPLLPESKRDELSDALYTLQNSIATGNYTSQRNVSAPDSPVKQTPKTVLTAVKSGSAQQLAITMSKQDVDAMLHDSIQKICLGDQSEKLNTLQSLVQIADYDRNLSLMIQHEPLMNTLCNSLKEYAKSSIPACTYIMTIFEKMSVFRNYHESLGKFKIGLMSLNLLFSQIHLGELVTQNNQPKEQKAAYIKIQNSLLRHIVLLLFNLSDSPKTMRKMVEKGIITELSKLLKRRDPVLLTNTLRFIRKLASVPTNWGEIDTDEIIPSISNNLFKKCQPGGDKNNAALGPVYKEALDLLFQFSQHQEIMEEFKEGKIFENMTNLCSISSIRSNLLTFFYQVSSQSGTDDFFKKDEILNMLIASASEKCPERIIALVVLMKLTNDKDVAAKIANSPIFTKDNVKSMFIQATSDINDENRILLKLIRNVSNNNPALIEGFDEEIVAATEKNKRQYDNLIDIVAVANRSEIDSPRSKFFIGKTSFISILIACLNDTKAPAQLHLEIIMFFSSLTLFSSPAKELEKQGIVPLTVRIFLNSQDDLDLQTQCLFAFYRFIIHGETRKALISHQEIVDVTIQHSASSNSVLADMASHVLDALVTFDKEWADKIRLPRFLAYNQDWLKQMNVR